MSLSTRSRTNSLLQTAGNLTVGDMIGQSSDLPETALKHYSMPKPLALSPRAHIGKDASSSMLE